MMITPDHVPSEQAGAAQDEPIGVRPRSMLSYAALLLGIASAAAIVSPAFLLVAALGVVTSLLAMRRVSRFWPELGGWRLAVAGLTLSLLFAALAGIRPAFDRWRIQQDGQRFVAEWLDYLQGGEPEKAHHLMLAPALRLPIDEELMSVYVGNANRRAGLENFITREEIQALLALGDAADVRLYSVEEHIPYVDGDDLALCYAVTFDEAGGDKKTFFILVGARRKLDNQGRSTWQIQQFQGGYRPKTFGEEGGEGTRREG